MPISRGSQISSPPRKRQKPFLQANNIQPLALSKVRTLSFQHLITYLYEKEFVTFFLSFVLLNPGILAALLQGSLKLQNDDFLELVSMISEIFKD